MLGGKAAPSFTKSDAMKIEFEKKRVRQHVIPFRQFDYRASALGVRSVWQSSPQSALIDLAERLPHFFIKHESQ